MSMTNRGAMSKGGAKAYESPFRGMGRKVRRPITVDNSYNRGRIPAYSLWAPSDKSSNPWKYMPYIPCINIAVANSTSSLDIPNQWADYFRAGDEVIVFDISKAAAGTDDFYLRGQSGEDLSSCTLGTDSCTISAVGAKDSGGTGHVLITLTDALNAAATGGARGTGDILVLAGSSTSTAIKAYQEPDNVVIMEQEFDFADAITGTVGEGGYLVESAVWAYEGGWIDYNYINYYPALNTFDSSPAFSGIGQFINGTRFFFDSEYRG